MTTFDDILEEAGKFGRCQKRIFALLCVLSVPFAGVYVGIVFQGFTPDHWCRDSEVVEWRQTCGWSLADSRRLMVPLVNSSDVLQPSSCEQYEVDWNSTAFTCDTEELDFSKSPITACKRGWEYDYEGRRSFVTEVSDEMWRWVNCNFSIKTFCLDDDDLIIVCVCVCSQFDLVCSNAWLVDMYQATLNVGFLVGSIAIGYLADR